MKIIPYIILNIIVYLVLLFFSDKQLFEKNICNHFCVRSITVGNWIHLSIVVDTGMKCFGVCDVTWVTLTIRGKYAACCVIIISQNVWWLIGLSCLSCIEQYYCFICYLKHYSIYWIIDKWWIWSWNIAFLNDNLLNIQFINIQVSYFVEKTLQLLPISYT